MHHISQNDLKKMMLLSYEKIEKEKEAINKINVFPVPDQDTGNNMVKTLAGIKKEIQDKNFESISAVSEAILDGALTAAQGNAGVIYTGFLAGFLPELTGEVNVGKLTIAFEKGAERAKESIQDPKQGTILDVIDAAALTFKEHVDKEKNIINVFQSAVKNADKALIETREKMEILKKANVVDAGGMAFLIILESFLEALKGKIEKIEKQEKRSEKIKRFIQIISNRYEVVALIANPILDTEKIKEKLKSLGDSIDIVQVKNKMKIHIHSDYPDEVKAVLRKAGEIKNIRVEDVAKEVVGEESVKVVSVGIVCESSSMLLPKIIERYQIELIDCEKNLSEKKAFKQTILEKLKTGKKLKLKSSNLNYKTYLDVFEKQLAKFNHVICITSSSKLYDHYDLAKKARGLSSQPKRIFVFDSLNIGPGQSLVTLKTIELIQEQRKTEEILKELKKFVLKVNSCIIPERLKSKYEKIQLNPILEIKNGIISKTGVVLAQSSAEALTKIILKRSKKAKRIRLVMGYAEDIEVVKSAKKNIKSKIETDVSFINVNPPSVVNIIGSKNIIVGWVKL